MTGELRGRYQVIRRLLELPPAMALDFARFSLAEFPSSAGFALALLYLREKLIAWAHELEPSPQESGSELGAQSCKEVRNP